MICQLPDQSSHCGTVLYKKAHAQSCVKGLLDNNGDITENSISCFIVLYTIWGIK
jgi:hypothetical protein